jgi:hypothetical protein
MAFPSKAATLPQSCRVFLLLLPILNFILRVGMQTLGSSVRRRQNEVKGAEDEEILSLVRYMNN